LIPELFRFSIQRPQIREQILISWMFSQFAVLRNDMHSLLHWGDQIDWMPVAWLGVAGVLLLLGRMLVVWFYWRRVLTKMSDDSDMEAQIQFAESFSMEKPSVPHAATSFYYLSGVAFIIVTLWGIICTAWWMILVGFVAWVIIHRPFHAVMQSWSQFHNMTMVKDDTKALLSGKLSPEQERVIKKRLGI
jgi:hypothetical protein